MGVYQFSAEQKIPSNIEAVWDFISSPANLKEITPGYMGFDIISGETTGKMYPGMMITYRVSPLFGLKMTWVTEITHIREGEYFVDEQRAGPYALWHHEHFIQPIDGGVLMRDLVTYRPPMGFFGAIANRLFIGRKLREIFDFRYSAVEKKFGKFGLESTSTN